MIFISSFSRYFLFRKSFLLYLCTCLIQLEIKFTSKKQINPMDMQQQLVDQRRGRYVRVSDIDRRQLIETYKKGEDFIALAKKLNIKRSTGK